MSGQYQQFLTNTEGCDSVLNIDLDIYQTVDTSTYIKWCGLIILNDQIIDVSGTYTFNLFTEKGCDSLVIVELEIVEYDDGIIVNENEIMASEEEGDIYQWYDCDTEMMIEGATERTFSPEKDGSYRVQVFKEICSFFTDCVVFTLVNTKDIGFEVIIAPNPTNGIVYLKGQSNIFEYTFKIFDNNGRAVLSPNAIKDGIIDMRHLNSGIYLLRIERGAQSIIKKVMIY
jgi:hypothetical protein